MKQEIAKADKAINERDFDTVASCYTEEAVLVVKPGILVQGHEAIKVAHKKISDYFNNSLNVLQGDMVIIEAGDVALVLSKTYIAVPDLVRYRYRIDSYIVSYRNETLLR